MQRGGIRPADDATTDPVASARSFYPDDPVPGQIAAGAVDFDTYDAAAQAYRDCLHAAGVEVGVFELDPERQRYLIVTDRNPATDPQVAACYEDFRLIDASWQLILEQQAIRSGQDEHRDRLEQCLDQWDLDWDARMHKGELTIRLLESGISDLTCEPLR